MSAFNSMASGDGSAIQAALSARGMAPVTNQVGSGVPGAAPAPMAPQAAVPLPQGSMAPSPTAQTTVPQSESKIIIGALKNRLDAISKQEMPQGV